MKPFPLRPVFGWVLAVCLALALGCSKAEEPSKPPAALTAEQARQLQQRVANIQAQAVQLDARLAELRREQALALAALTTDTQTVLAELDLVNRQLGGKPVPPPAAHPGVKGAPAPAEKGPLGPLMRLLLIVVALVAILVIIKIFLGRLGGEDEEDDEDFAADEDPPAEDAPAPVAVQTPPPAAPAPPADAPESKPHDARSKPQT